jgi:uncharacterized membrane protein
MYPSFFPGTDNLSKYLLTVGFVLIFFAIIYPLQKEQELKLDELNLLMEEELLHQDISGICEKINELKKDSIELAKDVSSLKSKLLNTAYKDSITIEKLISDKKEAFIKKVEDAEVIVDSLHKKSTKLNFDIKKQNEIGTQIKSYKWFKWIFLCLGTIFIFLGFRLWLSSTYVDEMQKCDTLNQNSTVQHSQAATTAGQTVQYESSFIRIRKWVKSRTGVIRRFIKI